VPDRARVTPARSQHMSRPRRRPVRRRAGNVAARSQRAAASAHGSFDAGETSERLTLIEFTWSTDGRVQPVLFVRRELLD
jgi:hypothetical protein